MPSSEPRYHKTRDYWYCSHPTTGKQIYLGKDRNTAWRRFAALDDHPSGRPTFVADAVEAWKATHGGTWEAEELREWQGWATTVALHEIDRDHLRRFAKHMEKRQLSPQTMRHRMRLAKAVLRWCHENEWLDRMPTAPKLPVPVKRPKHYEADVIKAAWETLGHAKDILTFLVETAARPSEGCRLEWTMVKRNRTCELDKHKKRDAGSVRILHLTPLAVEAIESQPKRSKYVFMNSRGQPYTPSGLRSIIRRRGLPSVYALRHSRAQQMLDQGVSMEEVAAFLGHKDLKTVHIYAQVRQERLRELASNLKSMVG